MEGLRGPQIPDAVKPEVKTRKQLPVSDLRIIRHPEEERIDPPPEVPGNESPGTMPLGAGPPIPEIDAAALSVTISHPNVHHFTPLPESRMPDVPPVKLPALVSRLEQPWVPPPVTGVSIINTPAKVPLGGLFSPSAGYLAKVQHQITTPFNPEETTLGQLGFLDSHGYVVELDGGKASSLGEATYFTAVAATAVALNNYSADAQAAAAANKSLECFLDVLQNKSWGNPDAHGVRHPIRHVDWVEYNAAGELLRRRPLNRDSFAQIVAAGYYSFHCPKSSDAVRSRAKALIARWIEYLPPRDYRTHSNYIAEFDEFEREGDQFKHLYGDREGRNRISYLDPTTFRLLPHEVATLRRCGDSMGLNTTSIAPLIVQGWGILSSFLVPIADAIADSVTKVLGHLLDSYNGEISTSVELVPGWKHSKVKAKLKLELSAYYREGLLRNCRKLVREYVNLFLFRETGAPAPLSLRLFVGDLGGKLLRLLPLPLQEASALPFRALFRTALDQVFDVTADKFVLEDAIALSASALWACSKPQDSSMAGFLFWNYAVCFDTQPGLMNFVMEPARLYHVRLRASGNENGMWAWLSGGSDDVVVGQLRTFETHPLGWSQYAYASTPYDEWVVSKLVADDAGVHSALSPRIDYLALLGFLRTGQPQAPLLSLLAMLKEEVLKVIDGLVRGVRDEVERTGRFVEHLADEADNLVLKTVNAAGEVMYETFDGLLQTASVVGDVSGRLTQTIWRGGDMLFSQYEQAAKDFLPPFGTLVLFQMSGASAGHQLWRWSNGLYLSYQKWEAKLVEGVLQVGQRVVALLRAVNGGLMQQVWAAGGAAVLGWTYWRNSTELGVAIWEDCLEVVLRDTAGVVTKWLYTSGNKVLTEMGQWAQSTIGGAAKAVNIIRRMIRLPSTEIEFARYTGFDGALLDYRRWSASADRGHAVRAVAKNIQHLRIRGVASLSLECWEFNGGLVKEYGKWVRSLPEGTAGTVDQVIRTLVVPGGFEIWWFRDGVAIAGSFLDEAYNFIRNIFGAPPKAVGGVFS